MWLLRCWGTTSNLLKGYAMNSFNDLQCRQDKLQKPPGAQALVVACREVLERFDDCWPIRQVLACKSFHARHRDAGIDPQ